MRQTKNIFWINTLFLFIFCLTTSYGQDVYIQYGKASFYADKFQGQTTANGEKYDHNIQTAAHLSLPFGTKVKVTNLSNNKTTVVTINDRGPFVEGRIIDLSKSAAQQLDFIPLGVVEVKVEILNQEAAIGEKQTITQQKDTEPKEFYEIKASRIHPSGFGVQIGSFKELANLMRISNNLKNSYQKEITIQVVVVNKIKVYRIIIGAVPNRSDAERLLKRLQKEYPDCYVVEFEKL